MAAQLSEGNQAGSQFPQRDTVHFLRSPPLNQEGGEVTNSQDSEGCTQRGLGSEAGNHSTSEEEKHI